MWDIIEGYFEKLTPEDQKKVTGTLPKHLSDVRFRCFDGNNDLGHLNVTTFKIEKLGRFSRFKNRDLNSHLIVSLGRYRRMYEVFQPSLKETPGGDLTADKSLQ